MITRRELLASAGAATLAFARSGYAPKMAVQGYVWTQYFASRKIPLDEGMTEMFAACHRIGFHRIDLTSNFVTPELLPKTTALLKQYAFDLPDTYIGGVMHVEAQADKTIADAVKQARMVKDLGALSLTFNANPKPKGESKTEDELAVQSAALNRMGKALQELGVRLNMHQHKPEMQDNAREWRYMLKNTAPQFVGFCLDLDWVFRGGLKPMELLREAGTRVGALHLRSSQSGVWSEALGTGDIDYAEIARYLKKHAYQGLLVIELAYEKDTKVTRSLEEDLKISRKFAEKTFGVQA